MVLLLCTLLLFLQFTASPRIMCHPGHKWDMEKKTCLFCDNGTFMPEEEHFLTECFPCAKVRNKRTEYVIRECSFEEDALIGSYRQTDKNSCLSDKYYIHENNDGVKVCRVRTMPCRQGQFFVPGDKCSPCPSGTYMVDDHHNNMACNPCQQLPHNLEVDRYVAIACNITLNTSMTDGLPVDTASFNCSHLPDVYKNCLGEDIHLVDMKKTGNSTDHGCAALTDRNIDVVRILLITVAVFIIVFCLLLILNKYVTKTNKLYLSMMNYFADKQATLGIYLVIFLVILAGCTIVTLIVQTKDPAANIFLLLLKFVGALCFCGVVIIAVIYKLLYDFQHISRNTISGCQQPLRVADFEQNETT